MKKKSLNELILNRIKSHYNLTKEHELANFLKIGQTTLSNWKSRDSIDLKKIITICDELSPNWIINGTGNPLKTYHNPDEIDTTQILDPKGEYVYGSAGLVEEIDRLTKIVSLQEQTIVAQAKTIAVMEQLLAAKEENKVS